VWLQIGCYILIIITIIGYVGEQVYLLDMYKSTDLVIHEMNTTSVTPFFIVVVSIN
jgi:hypothetical protein